METATFATSVLHLHPVERKPLYHYRPGSRVLTVAAPGCTFACRYCQNFAISQLGRSAEARWSARPIAAEDLVEQAAAEGAGLAFSYSEPVLAAELTLALAEGARSRGVDVVWKTNGFVSLPAARRLAPALAAVNVDLKAADEGPHRRLTGAPLGPVLDAVEAWKEGGVWVEVATPIIPGFNDGDADLRAMARRVLAWGAGTPWHLVRFHPDYRLQDAPPTHPALLERAAAIAGEVGLWHVYVERAPGEGTRDTRCPSCGETVIRRRIWALEEDRLLPGGRCRRCQARLGGRWAGEEAS
jgi:pyruvate formate lyase activating enzyme